MLALTGYEFGLLVAALVFIAFALVVALVVPRTRPDFPSRWLGVFVGVCIALFVAQMGAVLALAELGEEESEEAAPTETTRTETTPTETTPTETTPTETTTTVTTETAPTETTATTGDPVAGREIFLSVAQPPCGSCHTLADAGTTGSVGPNLDDSSPSMDKVVERVTEGRGVMPSFRDSLTEEQIADVAAYVSSAAGS